MSVGQARCILACRTLYRYSPPGTAAPAKTILVAEPQQDQSEPAAQPCICGARSGRPKSGVRIRIVVSQPLAAVLRGTDPLLLAEYAGEVGGVREAD